MPRAKPGGRNEKAFVAEILVKNGMPVRKAMLAAGYRGSSMYRIKGKHTGPVERIRKIREQYLADYAKEALENGFNGKFSADRLREIAEKGKDFDSIAAIREHNKMMTPPPTVQEQPKLPSGIFIVPMSMNDSEWEKRAKSFESLAKNAREVQADVAEQVVPQVEQSEQKTETAGESFTVSQVEE